MNDPFFTQGKCDRCFKDLVVRKMSWFNNDTLCMDCINKERMIRAKLPNHGLSYEGCGAVPNV